MAKVSNAARLILFCADSPHVDVMYQSSPYQFADSWIGSPARGYGRMFNPRSDTGRKLIQYRAIELNETTGCVVLTDKGLRILAEERAKGYCLCLEVGSKPRVIKE